MQAQQLFAPLKLQCLHVQAEGSSLAARFSGNWEQCLDHDEEGHIFLDLDPELFKHILFYLRSRTLLSSPEDKVPFPQVAQDKQHAFRNLIKYLALEEYMMCFAGTAEHFAAAHPKVKLQGQMATVEDGSTYPRSLHVGSLEGDIWYMKCKVHALGSWMFFGIAAGIDVSANGTHLHYAHSSSFGWAPSQQFSCGNQSGGSIQFRAGDCVLLKADFLNSKLLLRRTEASTAAYHDELTFTLAPEQRNRAFFHVILYSYRDKVELLPVTPEDQALLP